MQSSVISLQSHGKDEAGLGTITRQGQGRSGQDSDSDASPTGTLFNLASLCLKFWNRLPHGVA